MEELKKLSLQLHEASDLVSPQAVCPPQTESLWLWDSLCYCRHSLYILTLAVNGGGISLPVD